MKEENIIRVLLILTLSMAILNIMDVTDISWWFVFTPVLTPLAFLICLAAVFCIVFTAFIIFSCIRDLVKKKK